MRPPGGGLGEGGLGVLREAGLRYCSPAGAGAGVEAATWRCSPSSGATSTPACVLPPLARVREQMTGSADPLEPDRFLAYLDAELRRLADAGGFAAIVLHPFMLEWFGGERLAALLERIAAAAEARRALGRALPRRRRRTCSPHAAAFDGGTTLDPTGWSG